MGKQWLLGSLLGLAMVLPGTVVLAQTAVPTEPEVEDDYTKAMNLGYSYANQFDYQTALINFRRALEERPEDVYANNAIANMEFYIERDRLAALQAQVDTLEARLNLAADNKDWVCVTATVDELIPFAEVDLLLNAILFVLIGLELLLVEYHINWLLAGIVLIPLVVLARF
ncbi:MAG: hypothetical protein F6K11_18400, partial [Leptolyngbya sp. SIO3F4]|nr:hypothetical protein [Leptolyngbya sp. SIO3F4]